jgi:hypothetical protein
MPKHVTSFLNITLNVHPIGLRLTAITKMLTAQYNGMLKMKLMTGPLLHCDLRCDILYLVITY